MLFFRFMYFFIFFLRASLFADTITDPSSFFVGFFMAKFIMALVTKLAYFLLGSLSFRVEDCIIGSLAYTI